MLLLIGFIFWASNSQLFSFDEYVPRGYNSPVPSFNDCTRLILLKSCSHRLRIIPGPSRGPLDRIAVYVFFLAIIARCIHHMCKTPLVSRGSRRGLAIDTLGRG